MPYKVGDNGYEADVLVGLKDDGSAVLYDLIDVKEKEIAEASDYGSDKKSHPVANTSATKNTISQTDTKSQEKSKRQSKAEQWNFIKNSNPATDDIHAWIRSAGDILTLLFL